MLLRGNRFVLSHAFCVNLSTCGCKTGPATPPNQNVASFWFQPARKKRHPQKNPPSYPPAGPEFRSGTWRTAWCTAAGKTWRLAFLVGGQDLDFFVFGGVCLHFPSSHGEKDAPAKSTPISVDGREVQYGLQYGLHVQYGMRRSRSQWALDAQLDPSSFWLLFLQDRFWLMPRPSSRGSVWRCAGASSGAPGRARHGAPESPVK